jgi:hypothetical protein
LNNIGLPHLELEQHDLAIQYLLEARSLYQSMGADDMVKQIDGRLYSAGLNAPEDTIGD